ncbi:MAG: TetR family transcriptional regulator [Sedimenticola sp.]|nr:MAG: TetR family transcriptional regulator [Sedimenticola sp.]
MTAMARKQIRGEALRERVLDIALELFSKQGYFNTSIHDIRRQAQVSIGAIYHHFESKEALARGLYLQLLDRIDAEIDAILMEQERCLARSRAVVSLLFELTEAEPQVMQFVLLAKHSEYLPDEPPICSSSPFVRMRQVLEEGIVAGEVRQMEPWVAATAMFGGAMRMMNLRLDGALQKPLPSYLDEVVECGWRAVLT